MNFPSGTIKFYCIVVTTTELEEACEAIGKDEGVGNTKGE